MTQVGSVNNVCKREGCGNTFTMTRSNRMFCSSDCKIKEQSPTGYKYTKAETAIAEKLGVTPRQVKRWLSQEQENIHFNNAEAITLALDLPHVWHLPPLDKWYYPKVASRPNHLLPLKLVMPYLRELKREMDPE